MARAVWGAISRLDSSALMMRAVAASLQDEFVDVWEFEPGRTWKAKFLSWVGHRASWLLIGQVMHARSAPPKLVRRITTDALASWAISLYQDVPGKWDAILIGASNGGVMHLATALGVPFLSQHFASVLEGLSPLDDVEAYHELSKEVAQRILRRNRDLAVIQHYDPLHNRLYRGHLPILRYKLLDLPEHYQSFIHQRVRPGGTIIFADCRYSWPQYLADERFWFQVGGLGGVPSSDYITGEHEEIASLQRKAGKESVGNWALPGKLAFDMPEAEWGSLPPLRDRVAKFARENGYRFLGIEGEQPSFFSHLAFLVWQKLLRSEDLSPRGVFIETNLQIAPLAARRAALLPLWLPRGTRDSLTFLKQMRENELDSISGIQRKPVFWLPMPTPMISFDMPTWDEWLDVLSGYDLRILGMTRRQYPLALEAFYKAQEDLADWVMEHESPVRRYAQVSWLYEALRELRLR